MFFKKVFFSTVPAEMSEMKMNRPKKGVAYKTTNALGTCPFSLSGIATTAASRMLLDPRRRDSNMDGATSYILRNVFD